MSDVSKSLRSLTKREQPWANRSGCSTKMSKWVNRSFFWANRSIPHFWAKNEWFARITDERIPSPAIISTVLLGLKVYSYNIFVGISSKYFKILSMCWDRICLGLFFFLFLSIFKKCDFFMLRYYVLSFYSMFSIVYLNTLIEWMNEKPLPAQNSLLPRSSFLWFFFLGGGRIISTFCPSPSLSLI